ncbi:hypothetical protein RIR_jg5819.t1 [Rhizophagus irregularis DAOM 181602=DAOM 197198]|nr:hypothetical protein RIR_jg5819.t1 [Rhizophagus irregularis DAOM 181602=DAOM 197198]
MVNRIWNINIKVIDDIISIGSSLEYNRFYLQEEIYSLLVKKCPEIKYLNICGTYEIVYHPEAKISAYLSTNTKNYHY